MTATGGFWGKLPSRGDFVRAGLPRGFTDPWDRWMAAGIQAFRTKAGPSWIEAWLEAPVWRFALPPSCCGEQPAIGLFVPSVDAAGRYFSLTVAALIGGGGISIEEAWLDHAEAAALAAIACDLTPDDLLARLSAEAPPDGGKAEPTIRFWTTGAPRVAAADFEVAFLPDGAAFSRMIDDSVTSGSAA